MIVYGALVSAVVGVAAWQAAQPAEPDGHDHAAELRNPDGSWKYTNELVNATSPYLLQHAHNPVDWRMWNEEAIRDAREQDKPIFLSVGYSTCYWCHVMERKVFSDPEIAASMNEHFINIKVDREQRPDLDEIYMTATQLVTGRGGWPNSVFLTPELKPFYAGTYFGPEDRGGRPGFPTLIDAIADAWSTRRSEVERSAEQITGRIRAVLGEQLAGAGSVELTRGMVDRAVETLSARYDENHGGFGQAPKFPQGYVFPLLLDVHRRTGDQRPREMALGTLRQMAAGGMHDHVGGGFHRYSTDGQWHVPHFEKMLYNQAQLAIAYLEAHELTGRRAFADVARDILVYVERRMTGPDGQFYSALDAETDAVEGAYYVWKRDRVRDLLDDEANALFDKVFQLVPVPEIPGHKHPSGKVLTMRAPLPDLAAELDVAYGDLRERVDEIAATLREARDQRALPRLDDKVIASWNGLMIEAYAHAGRVLDEPEYTKRAERAASFVLGRMRDEQGRLHRIWRKGALSQPAFHEDYAMMIHGLASLARTEGSDRWADAAADLVEQADELFWDDQGTGGYFYAPPSPHRIARSKSSRGGALPSGNAAMAHGLLTLATVTGDQAYRHRARETLQAFSGLLDRQPVAYASMAHALERLLSAPAPSASNGREDADARDAELDVVRVGDRAERPAGAGDAPPEPVRVSTRAAPSRVEPGGVVDVIVSLDIEPGWHVNAHTVSTPNLMPTSVDVRSTAGIEVEEIHYPASEQLETVFADEPLRVFSGDATIRARVRVPADADAANGSTLPMRVLVQYQACDDSSCLAPVDRVIELAVDIER